MGDTYKLERIVLDSDGIQALLKGDELADICEQNAARLTRATGMEYVPDVHIGRTRVNAAGYEPEVQHD